MGRPRGPKLPGFRTDRNTRRVLRSYSGRHLRPNSTSSINCLITKGFAARPSELGSDCKRKMMYKEQYAAAEMTGKSSDRVSNRACFGPYEVDLHTHELWKYGTKLKLIGQPFEILTVLLSRPGELVTREELRARLWPADTFVDFNHGLNAAVNKLRDALSDSAETPRYVETLPRRGYRFIGKIEARSAPASALAEPPEGLPALSNAPLPDSVLTPSSILEVAEPLRWIRYGAGILLLGILIIVIGLSIKRDVSGNGGRVVERIRPLTNLADSTGDPAFSPEGNSVAFVRQDSIPAHSGIFLKSVDSDQSRQLTHSDRDCCPVWSPDGRFIAFSRYENQQFAIYVVSADGGQQQKAEAEKQVRTPSTYTLSPVSPGALERKLDTGGLMPQKGEFDWSPDGKSIAFSTGSVFLLSLSDSAVHRVTSPTAGSQDGYPKFSSDGQRLLFVREHEIGLPQEILTTSVSRGEAVHVVSEPGHIAGAPQWSPDEKSVIFASDRTNGGHPALWRVSLDDPSATPVELAVVGSPTWSPAVSRLGHRLAYQRQTKSLSVWEMDLSGSSEKLPHIVIPQTSDTDQGPGPQYSPDGKRIAYMSDRSGTMEIWVSNRDGSDAFQLSAVGGAGTPRWSPDSQSVVFDTHSGRGGIVRINVQGGAQHVLVENPSSNVCPSWSRDGKWVYFASETSGRYEVWKVPAEGGQPVQVTHLGGHAALESLDGKYIYYAQNAKTEPEVWRIPVEGGAETRVPLVRPGTWASWQVVNGGILFVGPSLGHKAVLSFYDFATGRTTVRAVLDLVPFWLGATIDGKTVAFDQPGREQSQIMLVDNFR
jgi:Tol biopolymer transport system component/DNA-binding winged helix-turn-helix (wHTH) protein